MSDDWWQDRKTNNLLHRIRNDGQYCHEFEIPLSEEVTKDDVVQWVKDMTNWGAKVVVMNEKAHVFLTHDTEATLLQLAFSEALHWTLYDD